MQKNLSISLVASFLLATNLFSAQILESITVSSSMLDNTEIDTTYSTEIFTKKDIENSNSKDVYDFLSSQTSVNVMPNYGNTFSQKIDLRGYGIGDGYQNVVVMINGRKLNNVDMSSQLISSIPLETVEKIEILKGTGSVLYGDGANAGIINIITNSKYTNYIKTFVGKNGLKNGTLSLGINNEKLIFNTLIDYTSTNGSRYLSTGEKDENYNKNKIFNLVYLPTDDLELNISRTYSNMNIKYGGSLTLDEFNSNPNQVSNTSFTNQYLRTYVTSFGANYHINNNFTWNINLNDENKLSKYSSGYTSNYDYKSLNSSLNYTNDNIKLVAGIDGFNGDAILASSTTTKDNKAIFINGEYDLSDKLSISSGIRRENVDYTYIPDGGTELNKDINLNAFDLGLNYKLSDFSSIFVNYNKSYQAPDINRFFASAWVKNGGTWTSTTTFNGFIEPSKVDNYTIGYTNIQKNNKLKISIFRSNLKNEIYYYNYAFANKNTNIDKSYKHGIEFFDKYFINKNLYTSINYSYIIAKIDEENENNGAYNGKYLPGVSKHNVTFNAGYEINNINTILSHTFRSSAYAANDFENNFTQKQKAYNSTDFNISYNYKNIELFGKIQNLFDRKNGLWIKDNAIYPVNFERTYYAGMKVKF